MKKRENVLMQLKDDCDSLLSENDSGSDLKPRIAVWGLVKAGKSSLLNMLAGHVTNEYFKTGSIRTTRANSELEKDNYVLVDTPGLGIDKQDSLQAFKGLDSADVILFVHSPQGELDQEEIDLLGQIKSAYADATEQRLVLVISQLDKDQNGSMNAISNQIRKQLQDHLDISPKIFQISNTRYKKGMTENKVSLINKSGIAQLEIHLDILSASINNQLMQVRNQRKEERKAKILEKIDQEIREELQFISDISNPYIEKVSVFNIIMKKLKEEFNFHNKEIKAINKKIIKVNEEYDSI